MGIASHFIHTCDITRSSNIRHQGEPCRLVEKTQRIIDTVTGQATLITTYTLLLTQPDVKPSDEVTVEGKSFRIDAVLHRNARAAHHISVQLERIGAPRRSA